MGLEETISQLDNKDFLDKLYSFAYKRCSSSHEAEDLCSDIILALLKSLRKNTAIKNFHAFTWTVAHRKYADFCEKRKRQSEKVISVSHSDNFINLLTDPIDGVIESEADELLLKKIMREIAFLSKIYRDVMVLYYLDELRTFDIAKKLGISESAVKQRLFSARNTIKKEVEKVDNNNINLKPVRIEILGSGNPVGNDPRKKAERIFSHNLVYLCKNTARSVKEISDLLNVPMIYVEDELEIQCRGMNGQYGLLRKLDNGKYISNFIIVDSEDFKIVNEVYKQQADLIVERIAAYIKANKERILGFPFINKQDDIRFITWSLISRMIWKFEDNVFQLLKEKYLPDINITTRDFSVFGIASKQGEYIDFGFYGCDSNTALGICGYSKVYYANIYGKRLDKHFSCGHNAFTDPLLMTTLLAVKGLSIENLSDVAKEVAAKAIEVGYIKKENGYLYPKILVLDSKDEKEFYQLSNNFENDITDITEVTANKIFEQVKRFVPKHLINEYNQFVKQTTCDLKTEIYEKCIEKGILYVPDKKLSAEGTWMIVTK